MFARRPFPDWLCLFGETRRRPLISVLQRRRENTGPARLVHPRFWARKAWGFFENASLAVIANGACSLWRVSCRTSLRTPPSPKPVKCRAMLMLLLKSRPDPGGITAISEASERGTSADASSAMQNPRTPEGVAAIHDASAHVILIEINLRDPQHFHEFPAKIPPPMPLLLIGDVILHLLA